MNYWRFSLSLSLWTKFNLSLSLSLWTIGDFYNIQIQDTYDIFGMNTFWSKLNLKCILWSRYSQPTETCRDVPWKTCKTRPKRFCKETPQKKCKQYCREMFWCRICGNYGHWDWLYWMSSTKYIMAGRFFSFLYDLLGNVFCLNEGTLFSLNTCSLCFVRNAFRHYSFFLDAD